MVSRNKVYFKLSYFSFENDRNREVRLKNFVSKGALL